MKKIIAIFAVVASVMMVNADVMFWRVAADAPEYDYAMMRIGVAGDDGSLIGDDYASHYINEAGRIVQADLIDMNIPPVKIAALLPENFMGLSFIVELYDQNDEMTHVSNVYNFSDLGKYVANLATFESQWQSINPLDVTPFRVAPVPEPTSGLLILIGGALLSLRRRRA